MSSLTERYGKFGEFMQHNTKGVEIGIYSISGALFAISYYKMRPITKFGRSRDIPKHFIKKKVLQHGTIKAIEPNLSAGALLRIDHKPPFNLFFALQKTLPVKIYGVDINGNGFSWLQSVALNQKVEFLPISKSNSNYAECQVTLLQDPALNSKPTLDLAQSLISIGFAKTAQTPGTASTDAQLKIYFKKLQAAQAKAGKTGLPWPINVLTARLVQLIYVKLLPPKYRLPELVR